MGLSKSAYISRKQQACLPFFTGLLNGRQQNLPKVTCCGSGTKCDSGMENQITKH